MKLYLEKLGSHVQGALLPVYLISGEETLLVNEAVDTLRTAARNQGFAERELFHADSGTMDWAPFLHSANSMSLFAEKKVLEIRANKKNLAQEDFLAYWERPNPDIVVLVITDKLDKAAQNSAWFHALDRCGAHIAIWPLNDQDMPAWLAQRARQRGLSITADALAILQERTEGNLLAAAQELDKLHLLYGNEPINADQLREAVADSARYDVFQLIDAAHRGEALHVVRMLHSLAEEGEGAIAFLNAVLKDLRALVAASEAARQGLPVGEAMLKAGAWQQRLPLLQQTFKRHQSSVFPALLQRASRIDLSVKGMDTLQAEDALENLLLAIAGKKIAA